MIRGIGKDGTEQTVWVAVQHSHVTSSASFVNALVHQLALALEDCEVKEAKISTKSFVSTGEVIGFVNVQKPTVSLNLCTSATAIDFERLKIAERLHRQDMLLLKNSVYTYPQWQRRGRQVKHGETSKVSIDDVAVFTFDQTKIMESRIAAVHILDN